MAIRQSALVAALIPAIAFAAYVPGTNTTWNASNAAALLLANQGLIVTGIDTQAGTAANMTDVLAGLVITGLTCVPSGPAASGKFVLTMTSSTLALADKQFPRWIAKAFAVIMGCHESQVDVFLTAVRRLTTDDRRLAGTTTVNGAYNVYNPNRGRNIGLGIGLGLVAPAIGLGVGLPLGLKRGVQSTTPVSTWTPIPPTAAPLPPVVPTEAPEEGSSMPWWAGILLALAILACIGAAIFAAMQGKKKKKAPKKKAAPVREEIRVVEESLPMMMAPQPPMTMQYIQEPPMQYIQPVMAPQPTYYQSQPQVAYAMPPQTYQPVPMGGSISRRF